MIFVVKGLMVFLGTGAARTTVPYAYDVAGRIHEIGDVDRFLNPDPFAARYSYAPSGLISQIETRSGAAAQQCPYGGAACSVRWHDAFSYDGLARLADALYDSVPSGGRHSGYSAHTITYDPQGNLLTLNRYAPTSGSPSGTIVDQLSYNYTARTNRLASVGDGVTTDLDWDARLQIPLVCDQHHRTSVQEGTTRSHDAVPRPSATCMFSLD